MNDKKEEPQDTRPKTRPRKIKIITVVNGWRVKVGCQEVVFTNLDEMLRALEQYMLQPAEVERFWIEKARYGRTVNNGVRGRDFVFAVGA